MWSETLSVCYHINAALFTEYSTLLLLVNDLFIVCPLVVINTECSFKFSSNVPICASSADASSYLCPCSDSCLHLGAPEPHRSLWMLRWAPQP